MMFCLSQSRKLNGNIIGSNEEIIDRNGLLKQTVLF